MTSSRRYLKIAKNSESLYYLFCMYVGMRPEFWAAFQEKYRVKRIVEFYAATEGNAFLVNCFDKVGMYSVLLCF